MSPTLPPPTSIKISKILILLRSGVVNVGPVDTVGVDIMGAPPKSGVLWKSWESLRLVSRGRNCRWRFWPSRGDVSGGGSIMRLSRGDGGDSLVVGGAVGGSGLVVGGGVQNSNFEFKFRTFKFQFAWGCMCTSWTLCEEFDSNLEEWIKMIRARVG